MKKQTLAITLLVLTLTAAGCAKQPAQTSASTEAATAAETTAEAAEETTAEAEEPEEDSFSGTIDSISGNVLTITNNDDKTQANYDISEAEVTKQFDLSEGDVVYVEYYVEEKDPITAIALDVEESVLSRTMDPVFEGIVKDAANGTITVEGEDGESYSFLKSNAYVVAKDGIVVGKKVQVTYVGDLEDDSLAVKVVMEDSFDTPEAKINAIIGSVAEIKGNKLVLETDNGDLYSFVSDESTLEQFGEGDTVKVVYDGKITSKEISAEKVSAV